MYPGKNARLLGAEVEFVEAQYMVFTREAFKCWRSLIDLEKNRLGLAMDQVFKSICKVALGRVDSYTAHHTNDGGKGKRYNYTEAKAQRDKYVLELQNKFPGSYEAFGFGSGGRSLTRSPWYINKLSVVIQWVFDVNSYLIRLKLRVWHSRLGFAIIFGGIILVLITSFAILLSPRFAAHCRRVLQLNTLGLYLRRKLGFLSPRVS